MASPNKSSETARIDLPPALKDKIAAFKKTERVTAPTLPFLPQPVPQVKPPGDSNYQELLHNVYDAVLVTDMEGKIIDTNARAMEFLLYSHFELCSLHLFNIISGSDQALLETVSRNLENQRFTLIQAYGVRKDGSAFPCEIVVNRLHLSEKGELCFFVRDTTQRKLADDLLKTELNALHNSASGIVVTDLDAKLQYVNPSFLKMWRFENATEVHERDMRDFWSEKDPSDGIIQSIIKDGAWSGELIAKRMDATEFHVQISAAGNRDTDNRLVGIVFSFVDITERKKSQETMLHTQKLESLGVLAGGIAHDFNNLLAVVMGNAALAMRDMPPESPGHKFLNQIETAGRRGADLCKQMMAYAGRGTFALSTLNLNEIVQETAELLKISISKSATLKYELAESPPLVEADPTQIRQVLMNLVVNASEAVSEKSGAITITTGVMRADRAYLNQTQLGQALTEGDYAYMEVTDTGSGMDAETQKKIFDPFFTTKFTGRGLGLAAVLGIAHTHKAALKVYSELEHGTTFRFLLPCAHVSVRMPSLPPTTPSVWNGTGTALVIDDEDNVRSVVASMIEEFGFTPLVARDGIEGVKNYKEREKDITLVLLDMTMPKMSGEETFNEIRRINPNARILLMSGYSHDEMSARFSGKNLAGFIQKPFDLNQVRDAEQKVSVV